METSVYAKALFEKVREPESVRLTTKEFREDSDVYAEFIGEHMEYGGADMKTPVAELYKAFNDWRRRKISGTLVDLKSRTLTPAFKTAFGSRAKHVVDGKDLDRKTVTYFEGVRLR